MSLAVVIVSFGKFAITMTEQVYLSTPVVSLCALVQDFVFLIVTAMLLCGNVVYHLARVGHLQRVLRHQRATSAELGMLCAAGAPRITVLIPSYREEVRVIQQTVLSAALMECPERRVVVLLDDPPTVTGQDKFRLEATRTIIRAINGAFSAQAARLEHEHRNFLTRMASGARLELVAEAGHVASAYEDLANWIESWAAAVSPSGRHSLSHTDKLFIETVLTAPVSKYRHRAAELRRFAPDAERLRCEWQRIAALVRVEVTSFERKQYANLSHAPSKAMNLNSYIGLLDGCYREETGKNGSELVSCSAVRSTITIPPADYLVTLDADTFVTGDYALRLLSSLEGNPRVAVAQSPYSAVPGASNLIERVAGATTDIQYLVHQGFTQFGATFWVGANAIIRVRALQEIARTVEERDYRVPMFIQDRTVIEDTDSTIDLIKRGWTLYNYPERLAYSATPPDFGSLVIQRRRWSNGGLIILPDLIRYLCQPRSATSGSRTLEALMRCYYLCSPAAANFGFLLIVLFPWNDGLTSPWLPVAAVPYYFLYGRDLRKASYKWIDLLRVYALNLILLPVNLAGVLRSVQQIVTGRKATFGRTPKVQDRTAAPPVYVMFQWGMIAYLVSSGLMDVNQGHYAKAVFGLAHAALFLYGLGAFLGWHESWQDVIGGMSIRVSVFGEMRFVGKETSQEANQRVVPVPAQRSVEDSGRMTKIAAANRS